MTAKPTRNVHATVDIELAIPGEGDEILDAAADVIADVWEQGDPADETNAIVWVKDVEAIKLEAEDDE